MCPTSPRPVERNPHPPGPRSAFWLSTNIHAQTPMRPVLGIPLPPQVPHCSAGPEPPAPATRDTGAHPRLCAPNDFESSGFGLQEIVRRETFYAFIAFRFLNGKSQPSILEAKSRRFSERLHRKPHTGEGCGGRKSRSLRGERAGALQGWGTPEGPRSGSQAGVGCCAPAS